jgi:hypothetical protein
MSLDEVAERFRERDWPVSDKTSPANYQERAAATQQDPAPFEPGSFDDVNLAYDLGELTDEQYEVLGQAMLEAVRGRDQANG